MSDYNESAFSVYKKESRSNSKQEKNNLKREVFKKASKKQKFEFKKELRQSILSDHVLQKVQSKPLMGHKFRKIRPKQKKNQRNRVIVNEMKSEPKIFNDSLELQGDNPELDALQLFNWMIAPLSLNGFFQTYWERKVSHIKRLNMNYYRHIFNSSALDEIIRNHRLYYTQNVDVVSYEDGIKEVHNPDGRASAAALWDYYSNGCSIRILNPQTYNPRIHLLLATLQEFFGTMVGANVYLTPPNSQGFAPHYDDIEAFILQLEGQKHWKLYHPGPSEVLARFSSSNFEHKNLGDPFLEVTLKAGDLLYFPRGTIHEGRTDETSHSLHVTVSVYQQTSYTDLLQHVLTEALRKASMSDIEFRRGLPLNYLKRLGVAARCESGGLRSVVKANVESLVSRLVEFVDLDAAADLLGRKFMYDSMPPVLSREEAKRSSKGDGPCLQNGQVLNKVEIDLNTGIRLLRYYCVRLVSEHNSSHKLYYNTENAPVYHGEEEQWLELDSDMIPSIRMLQNSYPRYLKVKDLPLGEDVVKMQLVADLWEHGLIVTEYPLQTTNGENC